MRISVLLHCLNLLLHSCLKIKRVCCPGLLYCSSAAALPSHAPLLLLPVI
jgi:hypothetical protein